MLSTQDRVSLRVDELFGLHNTQGRDVRVPTAPPSNHLCVSGIEGLDRRGGGGVDANASLLKRRPTPRATTHIGEPGAPNVSDLFASSAAGMYYFRL